MTAYRRTVRFIPGYNKRAEGKGIHGMHIQFMFTGPHGATYFELNTGWVPGEPMSPRVAEHFPDGWALGHHWLTPTYRTEDGAETCAYLGGRPCYSDAGLSAADRLVPLLTERGESAVWRELIDYYRSLMADAAQVAVEAREHSDPPYAEQVRAAERERIAQAIWNDERKCQAAIVNDPTNAHLNGRLAGLQRARDIARAGGDPS